MGSKVLEFGWTAVPTALFLLQKRTRAKSYSVKCSVKYNITLVG